ncbi:hypothetical protein GGI07_004941 [Coemansia sp. Benny D115]|nr:hypothetical protein GGI07_004941 [Coemansia sp. Benny D115]
MNNNNGNGSDNDNDSSGDLLGRVDDLEEEFEDIGYAQGLEAGKQVGELEGRQLGCESGFDIGKDLGFYHGWAQQWLAAASKHPEAVPVRAQKKLQEIVAAVEQVPQTNVEGAHFSDRASKIQRMFKMASAMLGQNIAAELPANTLSF